VVKEVTLLENVQVVVVIEDVVVAVVVWVVVDQEVVVDQGHQTIVIVITIKFHFFLK
jgi:hypothetical protein